jgi:hypothetical protein
MPMDLSRPNPLPWAALVVTLAFTAAAAGCDFGTQADEPTVTGPPVTVSLANLPGQDIVPVNQPIILQFNRFLNPSTVARQSIQLLNASGEGFVDPVIDYDPVLLQVKLSNPSGNTTWLVEGQSYELALPVATSTVTGVQAIDNAALAQATKVDFKVGPAGASPVEPTMHFCVDVWPVFSQTCSGIPVCHMEPQPQPAMGPAQGLVLTDVDWVKSTAIGLVAHESNVGAMANPSSPGAIFGIDMPILDPGTDGVGNPGNSWLLYKVLLGAPASKDLLPGEFDYSCKGNPFTTAKTYEEGVAPVITQAERGRLSNFLPGREMPYPGNPDVPESEGGGALTVQEMERLRLWIKQGTQFDDVSMLPDGGTTCDLCGIQDAGPRPMDGGTMKDATPVDAPHDGPSDGGTKGQ